MVARSPQSSASGKNSAQYRERWRAPWWLWAAGLLVAVGTAAEIHLGYSGARSVFPYAITIPLMVGALWWLGRIEVRVTDDELRVDDARLELRFIADAEPLSAKAREAAMGQQFDPLAFVVRRPWLRGAVLVRLSDPNDPTPYWIVASRRPTELADAIRRAGARGDADPALAVANRDNE